jgi:glycosyltransferase involved in cell wall biosynthesis
LPFWLEPGIDSKEKNKRRKREIAFIKDCNHVICTSAFILDILKKEGVNSEKISVFQPRVEHRHYYKKVYNKIPEQFLVVGGIHYGKGLDLLIESLGKIENRNWTLSIAGYFDKSDSYYSDLVRKVEKLSLQQNLTFLGECDKNRLEKLYLASDLLIHPSRFESFGMAIGEAIGFGIPVISSDAGALPDIYSESPVLFFKSEDIDSLGSAIKSVLKPAGYTKLCNGFKNFNFKSENWDQKLGSLSDLINKLNTE